METQILTEERLKAHLRLDDDVWFADKAVIEVYAIAAEEALFEFIGRPLDEIIDRWGKVPPNMILALLYRVTSSYTHRDPNSSQEVVNIPSAQWQDMLKPYVKEDEI